MEVTGIESPPDLVEGDWRDRWLKACNKESPAWGWDGEGEDCQRVKGHDGPCYFKDADWVLQWQALR